MEAEIELKFCYHPVLQEIKIKHYHPVKHKFEDLNYEIFNNGKLILQDIPQDIFDNLFCNIGTKNIKISFMGTKMDYEDFKMMVNYYNEGNLLGNHFSLIDEFEELPSVDTSFDRIKEASDSVLNTLKINLQNEDDNSYKNRFEDLQKDILSAYNAEVEPINLCFVGAYSTGKSTLINALLGAKILPTADESKTAKLFRISNSKKTHIVIKSLLKSECNSLEIDIYSEDKKLYVNSKYRKFRHFTEIKKTIDRLNEEQTNIENKICDLFDYLNGIDEISDISLHYPIKFMGEKRCIIYDTPGTDSDNCAVHEAVLDDILCKQRNSILFIVLSPTKMEGRGTQTIFNLLRKAEDNPDNVNGTNLSFERCFLVMTNGFNMDGKDYDAGLKSKTLKYHDADGKESIFPFSKHRFFLVDSAWV